MRAPWFLLLALTSGCGDNVGAAVDPGDGVPPDQLEALIDDYQDGVITRDQLRDALGAIPDSGRSIEVSGTIAVSTLLSARDTPYLVSSDLDVAAGAILVLAPGAALTIATDVNVDIAGRFYAVGDADSTVVIDSPADATYYDTFALRGGPNQIFDAEIEGGRRSLYLAHPADTTTLVEDCRFDEWSSAAVAGMDSGGITIRRSRFGYDTPEADVLGESIRIWSSGATLIEDNEFSYRRGYRDVIDLQECVEDSWPVVRHNRFDGGEDDAVDLDGCSAFVIGNYIHDFRPVDLDVQEAGVNGGGVTGDRVSSHPFIANNVIDGCFHGVGFKDGASPVIVNNTIINSNIGIALYHSASGKPDPSGVAVNNVLWNNLGWLDDEPNDVVLNGSWWAGYDHTPGDQASIDARYNITATLAEPYPGEGNLDADPELTLQGGETPVPAEGSPAIDSGLGDLSFEGIPLEQALDWLATDFDGNIRTREGGGFTAIDRGAIEVK